MGCWGPTGVALVQSGPWTIGALANHVWSFAGDSSRSDVNSSFCSAVYLFTTRRMHGRSRSMQNLPTTGTQKTGRFR